MSPSVRKTFLALGAFCALAVGGAALAGAATSTKTSTTPSASSAARPRPPMQEQVTGDTADKVKAAALAKVPGATVLRVETGGHGGAAYHVHMRKSDGTEVVVLVNKDFVATSVETKPAGGPGHRGPGGPGHRGRPGGRSGEKALTGDTAAKVKAAAEKKVSGGTVLRVETDADHGSPYEAHVRKADGTEVEVLVNKDFEVTAVNEMQRP